MKARKRWQYYCEYCKKSGGSGGMMAKHERSCTGNPNRICKFCKNLGNKQEAAVVLGDAAAVGLDELVAVAGECPACILAGIRNFIARPHDGSTEYWDHRGELKKFDFKACAKDFWDTENDKNFQEETAFYG